VRPQYRSLARVLTVAFGACALLACSRAEAQTPTSAGESRWLVIPSTVGSTGNPAHLARKAAQQLTRSLDAQGRSVLSHGEARRAFEQRGSAPPIQSTASDVDALARDAQQALYHVASGLYSRAQQDVARAMSRARSALESLNRESRAARHLLDACMYLVRGHLERRDRVQARRQALECRRLVPDIQPDSTMHPPDVIGVLAEAEAELLDRDPSSLRIESVPMGCAVLVNGRNLGTTPKELPRLPPGEYRVQVECHDGEPGRVHRAMLSNNRVVIRVDTRFDRAVQTAFDLSLRYTDQEEEQRHRIHDGLEAARAVGASDLVLVAAVPEEAGAPAVQAIRLRVADGARLATADLQFDIAGGIAVAAVDRAARALLDARKPRLIAEQPRATAPVAPAPRLASETTRASRERVVSKRDRDHDSGDETLRTAGLVAAGLGLTADIAGWALYANLLSLQLDHGTALREQSAGRFDVYRAAEAAELAPKLVLGAGAAVLGASAPLWLPEQRGIPWWAWTAGGAGAVAVAFGVKLALDAGDCLRDELGRCVQPELATQLGTQLLLQAIPFLTIPLVYAVRSWTGARASAQISLRASDTEIRLTWTRHL
jgi:hypothetical protein